MKIQATDWEKIFVNHISKNGLVSGIYKELSKLNSKETTQLKMGKRRKQTFHQRGYTDGK